MIDSYILCTIYIGLFINQQHNIHQVTENYLNTEGKLLIKLHPCKIKQPNLFYEQRNVYLLRKHTRNAYLLRKHIRVHKCMHIFVCLKIHCILTYALTHARTRTLLYTYSCSLVHMHTPAHNCMHAHAQKTRIDMLTHLCTNAFVYPYTYTSAFCF